ncbi:MULTISPECIES: glycosyltransferase family 2 protein [unclassified Methylophilus]|uniref:glycosyltransferase family 2 protein n=1 Tax=unclassified Methylophilus TaxID=2630143 RepID=UPI000369E58B|nr:MULTISPECIES: glycosyltransferase family 2 protein [unclassified Methylophilus]
MRTHKDYTAVIRTYNSLPLLLKVLDALKMQTIPPSDYVIVDSSKDYSQKEAIKKLGLQVVDYPDEEFNFSKAINIGVDYVKTELVLIISSHVLLNDRSLIEKGLALESFSIENYLGFCLTPAINESENWEPAMVTKYNFSLDLAASNSCTMLKTLHIQQRPFLEEVFSAEDQEWAAYYLREKEAYFYRVKAYEAKYLNVNMNDQKIINEQIALAYYTHREMLGYRNIIMRLFRAVVARVRGRTGRARLHFTIAKELFVARSNKPVKKSKYF